MERIPLFCNRDEQIKFQTQIIKCPLDSKTNDRILFNIYGECIMPPNTFRQGSVKATYKENYCDLTISLQKDAKLDGGAMVEKSNRRPVRNVRNCDIFVDDYHFLLFADVQLFKYHSRYKFDLKDMKNILVKFNSSERTYSVRLPCLDRIDDDLKIPTQLEKGQLEGGDLTEDHLDLWKLKGISKQCRLQLDDAEPIKFEAAFGYGFASKFHGKLKTDDESELAAVPRMPEPHRTSPLQRSIDREVDDLKNFSQDEYKSNFIELQIPEGHDNPLIYTFNYDDVQFTKDDELLLHNLTRRPEDFDIPHTADRTEIDCGLIDILLAICYDIRSTSDEATCESGWTRSKLSATLSYFQPFDNLKDVVVSFLRLSVVYPMYRNYNYSRLCVEDAIEALQRSPKWILKQLLTTHRLFATSEPNRCLLNRHYVEDYIRYVHNNTDYCTRAHLQTLGLNLKNVLFDVNKKNVRLDLVGIETELLKELITDLHSDEMDQFHNDDEEDDDDGEEEDVLDDSEDYSEEDEEGEDESSSSDTEGNSVIEQRMADLKV